MNIIDQTRREIKLNFEAKKIICLVPSITEYLFDLGLENNIIGITKFCIKPKNKVKNVSKIGGTKQLKLQLIDELKPDLIIANKEENIKSEIEYLCKKHTVYISDVNTINEAYKMMLDIGVLTSKENESKKIVTEIKHVFNDIKNLFKNINVVYFIWKKPYMLCGDNTYINSVLTHLGFKNLINHLDRYPQIEVTKLIELNPDVCLLSTEPYPFNEKDCLELNTVLAFNKSIIVDGEMFSWYGSRMLQWGSYSLALKKSLSNLKHLNNINR
jgi:ABC-type Fe3+-hydroxamate transport system substrate-binding protein